MSEKRALELLLQSIAAFLSVASAWLVVGVLGGPWWAFLVGALIAVLWRAWQFWRAR